MLFYNPPRSLSLVHYYSKLPACVLTSVSFLNHPECPGLFSFLISSSPTNVLRPSSIAKHHDNYSTVPNLYTYVRSVPCINTIYGGEEGKRKWGTRSAAPTMSTPKPSDITSGDSIGGFAASRPCLSPLVRREGNGEDGGASMSCTYPIDLKPRTLSKVDKY